MKPPGGLFGFGHSKGGLIRDGGLIELYGNLYIGCRKEVVPCLIRYRNNNIMHGLHDEEAQFLRFVISFRHQNVANVNMKIIKKASRNSENIESDIFKQLSDS